MSILTISSFCPINSFLSLVPVKVNIDQPLIKQSNRNSAILKCNITGYPRLVINWFKLQQRNNPSFKTVSSSSNQELNSDQLLKLYKEAIKNRDRLQPSDYDNNELSNTLDGGPSELKLASNHVYRYVQINGTIDSKYSIENRMLEQFDDSQMQSMLKIHRLDADDNALYICRARNSFGNTSENSIHLTVLETPKLRLVNYNSLNSRSIEFKLAILHNSNAPVQQLIIALRNNNQTTANNTSAIGKPIELQANSLSSPNDWIIMDIINLQSDQIGNVISGLIDVQLQNHTEILLSQFLDNQQQTNSNANLGSSQFNSKQTRESKLNANKKPINKFELVEPNVVRYVINNLQPKADYSVQVFAQNQVGRSAISPFNVATQADVPSRISSRSVYILTKTNETLLYGWKRSADNGAMINRYEVQLAHAHPENHWLRNETKDVNLTNGSGGGPPRNNYMYIFVNLKPGSIYYFRVRACNEIGCSEWSQPPLLGITQDGHSDSPESK